MGEKLTDDHLVDRLRASDEESFRVLFERYQPIVFRQALFQTHDSDTAHEVAQETFVRIWTRRASLRPGRSFLAYALRISGNIVRDMGRHRAMRERVASTIPTSSPSEGEDPAEAVQLAMLEEQVTAIINQELPTRCRAIFLLSRFEGMTHREIAELLGLKAKTVENQINHALRVLRKRLP